MATDFLCLLGRRFLPISRPQPDCLKPPNGQAGSAQLRVLTPLAPNLGAARDIPLTYPKPARIIEPGDVAVTRTRLFRSNRSQAVRLPKVLRSDTVEEVSIVREGNRRVIGAVERGVGRFF